MRGRLLPRPGSPTWRRAMGLTESEEKNGRDQVSSLGTHRSGMLFSFRELSEDVSQLTRHSLSVSE